MIITCSFFIVWMLTQRINYSFYHLYLLFYYQLQHILSHLDWEGHYASAHKNSAKIGANVFEISYFFDFPDSNNHHVELLKGQKFI